MRVMQFKDNLSLEFQGAQKTTYLYRDRECDELVGLDMCAGEKMAREKTGGFIISPEGRELIRAFREDLEKDGYELGRQRVTPGRPIWPMTSINAGVNPDQVEELREFWREHKITGCDVTPEGDVIWDDRAARKADCEARGLYDRDGGYGDPQPKHL